MNKLKNIIIYIFDTIGGLLGLKRIYYAIKPLTAQNENVRKVLIETYLKTYLHDNPKYSDPKKLNKFEFQVYSQNGEDGMIEEIFRRIGTTNKYFVEFGVENGLENNTLYLLLQDWKGSWVEGGEIMLNRFQRNFIY